MQGMPLTQESIRKPEEAQWMKWARPWWDTGTGFCGTVWTGAALIHELYYLSRRRLWHQVVSWRWLERLLCSEHSWVLKKPYWRVQARLRKAPYADCTPTWHILLFHPPIKKKCFWDCRRAWNFEMCQLKSSALRCCSGDGRQGEVALLRGLGVQTCLGWALASAGSWADPPSLSHISIFLFIVLLCHLLCWFVQYQLLLSTSVLRCFLRSIIKSQFKKSKPHQKRNLYKSMEECYILNQEFKTSLLYYSSARAEELSKPRRQWYRADESLTNYW